MVSPLWSFRGGRDRRISRHGRWSSVRALFRRETPRPHCRVRSSSSLGHRMGRGLLTQTQRTFSMACRVEVNIRATAERIVPNARMTWGSMPDFGPVFARFATDLKHEAERG